MSAVSVDSLRARRLSPAGVTSRQRRPRALRGQLVRRENLFRSSQKVCPQSVLKAHLAQWPILIFSGDTLVGMGGATRPENLTNAALRAIISIETDFISLVAADVNQRAAL